MSILPQAQEVAGVAEYIVLAEAVAQIGMDSAGTEDQHLPIASATDALPASVATRIPTIATAVSATSSDSTRPPARWGVGIPIRSSASRSSSSRPPIPDPAAQAGGPPNLDEFINGPTFDAGGPAQAEEVNPPSK